MMEEEFETIDCTQPQKVEPSQKSYPPPSSLPSRYQRQGSILDHPSFFCFSQPAKTQSLPEAIHPPSPPVTRVIPPFPLTAADFALVEGIDEGTYRAVKRAGREEKREERAARKKLRREEGRKEVLRKVNGGWEVVCVEDDGDDEIGHADYLPFETIEIDESVGSTQSGRETSPSASSSRTASGASVHSNSTSTLPDEPLPEPPFDASQVVSSSKDVDLNQPPSSILQTDHPASLEPNFFSNDGEDLPQTSNESAQESEPTLAVGVVKASVGRDNGDNQDITMEQHPEESSASASPTRVPEDREDISMDVDSDVTDVSQTPSTMINQLKSDIELALENPSDNEDSINLPKDQIDGLRQSPSFPLVTHETNIAQLDSPGCEGLPLPNYTQHTQHSTEDINSTNIGIQDSPSLTVEEDADRRLDDPSDHTGNTTQPPPRTPSSSSIDMPCSTPALIQASSLPYPTHSQCTNPQSQLATPNPSQIKPTAPASWIDTVESPFTKLGRGAPKPSRNHVALPKPPFSVFKLAESAETPLDARTSSSSDAPPSDKSKCSKVTNGYLPTPSPSPSPSKPSKIVMQGGPPPGWTIAKFYPV